MNERSRSLIDMLFEHQGLDVDEYAFLIEARTPEMAEYAAKKAVSARKRIYGNTVYVRGLIEVGNVCKNDCRYCGIRRSNSACERYRLSAEEVLECCREGYALGFRTFVMQGGEDPSCNADVVCDMVRAIKARYPDCAVTLSLGEYTRADYQQMFDAGADRYLLRHESADREHYQRLHPAEMSFDNRMRCLSDLKAIGFQTGCGFMVGSPYQTARTLALDLKFVERFAPEMCGIGPFIPHSATPFADKPSGSLELTLYLLSLLRLIKPNMLLPATTALGAIDPGGREAGILAGANVIMPNLSPVQTRRKYALYNNRLVPDAEPAQSLARLKQRLEAIGYEIVSARGDAQ